MKRSLDMRERALVALEAGMNRSQVCLVFGIHCTTLGRWQKRAVLGTLDNLPVPGAKRVLESQDEEHLVAQLQAHSDATVDEHLRLWQGSRAIGRAAQPS